jgi:hypothetical protein
MAAAGLPREIITRLSVLASVRHQRAAFRTQQKIAGHAAENPFAHPAVSIRACHDQISLVFLDERLQPMGVIAN